MLILYELIKEKIVRPIEMVGSKKSNRKQKSNVGNGFDESIKLFALTETKYSKYRMCVCVCVHVPDVKKLNDCVIILL